VRNQGDGLDDFEINAVLLMGCFRNVGLTLWVIIGLTPNLCSFIMHAMIGCNPPQLKVSRRDAYVGLALGAAQDDADTYAQGCRLQAASGCGQRIEAANAPERSLRLVNPMQQHSPEIEAPNVF
jgi:hypothetical protein